MGVRRGGSAVWWLREAVCTGDSEIRWPSGTVTPGSGTTLLDETNVTAALDELTEAFEVAHTLFKMSKVFWRSWATDTRRTEEERSFLRVSAMIPPESSAVVAPPVQPTISAAPTSPTGSVSGRAWIEIDKNRRQEIHVDVGAAPRVRKLTDVAIEEDLVVDRISASKEAPRIVSVELKGDKIMSVKRT